MQMVPGTSAAILSFNLFIYIIVLSAGTIVLFLRSVFCVISLHSQTIVKKMRILNPIVAKTGWLQRRDIKGEAVIIYRYPLITKELVRQILTFSCQSDHELKP